MEQFHPPGASATKGQTLGRVPLGRRRRVTGTRRGTRCPGPPSHGQGPSGTSQQCLRRLPHVKRRVVVFACCEKKRMKKETSLPESALGRRIHGVWLDQPGGTRPKDLKRGPPYNALSRADVQSMRPAPPSWPPSTNGREWVDGGRRSMKRP